MELSDYSTVAAEIDSTIQAVKTALEPYVPATSWRLHGDRSFTYCEAENVAAYHGELWHADIQLTEQQLGAVTAELEKHGFSPTNLFTPDNPTTGFDAAYHNPRGDLFSVSSLEGAGVNLLARTECRLDGRTVPQDLIQN